MKRSKLNPVSKKKLALLKSKKIVKVGLSWKEKHDLWYKPGTVTECKRPSKPSKCGFYRITESPCSNVMPISKFKKTPLKKVSTKRSKELREYSVLRKHYLIQHPTCQVALDFRDGKIEFPEINNTCECRATDIHHKARRTGKYLNMMGYWMQVCRPCHDYIEKNTGWSYSQGYLTKLSK